MNELAPGVAVGRVVQVNATDDVADVLRDATANSLSIIPFGGQRSLATGNPAEPADIGLNLRPLRGIIGYEPADLTLSVWAGTLVAEIQEALGEHGQELPIDVPFPAETTIGGLVATGFAGPRRLRSGSLRDLLIGCEFVRGDGMVAKAGGLVVKNVSGFEIPRFLHGSWGALAVLTSVNLKVTPRPRADGMVAARFDDVATATDAALRLIAAEPSIEACVVLRMDRQVTVAARAVGRAAAVSETLRTLAASLGGSVARIEGQDSAAFWQNVVDAYAEGVDRVVVAMNTRAREMSMVAKDVDRILPSIDGAGLLVSPGVGTLRLGFDAGTPEAAGALRHMAELANRHGASYVVESAPPAMRALVPPWGIEPDGLDLMRSVKREFDPSGVLNPRRLFV